jgi:hypothetical protein
MRGYHVYHADEEFRFAVAEARHYIERRFFECVGLAVKNKEGGGSLGYRKDCSSHDAECEQRHHIQQNA